MFFFAALGTCGIVFFAANFISRLPAEAEKIYGKASPFLSNRERYSLSLQLWLQQNELMVPADANGSLQEFQIALDEPTASVIGRLAASGLIKDGDAFRNYLIYTGLDNRIQAGEYLLSASMTSIQIAMEILDATSDYVEFIILPGWRLEEIAELLPSSGLSITIEEFLAAAQNPPGGYSFSDQIPPGLSVEGFLMPGTYEISRDLTAEEFIVVLLNKFEQLVTVEIRAGLAQQGLSLREGVILASIVAREAVVDEEQILIAAVFLNRLQIGMPLEADPTVQYALGYNAVQSTWWTNPLSVVDLKFDSAYNTYVYGALPPGPIANPSLNAIIAVAFPAQTPHYYFRAACDNSGRHNFAETFGAHQANACN